MKTMFILSIKESVRGRRYLHRTGCPLGPHKENGIQLGRFDTPGEAMDESHIKGFHPEACPFCCGDYRKTENERRMREMVFSEAQGQELIFFTPRIFIPAAYIN